MEIFQPHIAFYKESIRFHCVAALNSVEYVASFIEMTNETKGDYKITGDKQNQVLDHLQNILTHAASISRYFWPSKAGVNHVHKERGEKLRSIFKIEEGNALKNRELRNQLEHLDENLDHYLTSQLITGFILPSYVGGEIERDGTPAHLFRAFYIDSGIFEVLGVRHEVQPIVDEIYNVYDHCEI